MLTLYHAPYSRSTRMLWLLEEIGEPYEIRPVSIFRPMTGDGEGDAANPHPDKKVPTLVHDGELYAESLAIVLHLADAFPDVGLAPAQGEQGRGEWLTWMGWYATELEPALFASMGGELEGNPIKKRYFDQVVARLEHALADGPFLMGERFSGCDLLVSSALTFSREAFPESAAIDAFIARCQARPAFARGMGLDDASGVQGAVAA